MTPSETPTETPTEAPTETPEETNLNAEAAKYQTRVTIPVDTGAGTDVTDLAVRLQDGQSLADGLPLGGEKAVAPHARVHLQVHPAGLVEVGQDLGVLPGAQGEDHLEVDQYLELREVGGGAEHEDLRPRAHALPDIPGLRGLGDGKAADAVLPA